jgi:hypothetical protein
LNLSAGDTLASRLYVLRPGPGGGSGDIRSEVKGSATIKMEGSVNDQGVDVPLKKQAQKWKSAQVTCDAMLAPVQAARCLLVF